MRDSVVGVHPSKRLTITPMSPKQKPWISKIFVCEGELCLLLPSHAPLRRHHHRQPRARHQPDGCGSHRSWRAYLTHGPPSIGWLLRVSFPDPSTWVAERSLGVNPILTPTWLRANRHRCRYVSRIPLASTAAGHTEPARQPSTQTGNRKRARSRDQAHRENRCLMVARSQRRRYAASPRPGCIGSRSH
jgi:hypothetical protein